MKLLKFIRHLCCRHSWSYYRLLYRTSEIPVVEVVCLKCGATDVSAGRRF